MQQLVSESFDILQQLRFRTAFFGTLSCLSRMWRSKQCPMLHEIRWGNSYATQVAVIGRPASGKTAFINVLCGLGVSLENLLSMFCTRATCVFLSQQCDGNCFGDWYDHFQFGDDPPSQHDHLSYHWARQHLPLPGLNLKQHAHISWF